MLCKKCNKEFVVLSQRKYFCSKACRYAIGNPPTTQKCLECNNYFTFYKSVKPTKDAKWCSIICRRKWNGNHENKIENLRTTFEKLVIKKEGCWDWKGKKFQAGYGQISFMQKSMNASRASWIIHNGLIPKKLWVLHICDNPICTNPEHLFLGTCKDNVHDMIKKGRKPKRNFYFKLNKEKILAIKKLIKEKILYKEIAKKFNVSLGIISYIKYKEV